MSNNYIGTDPIYQNHANDVDAPLASEDPAVAALEQLAKDYETEAASPANFLERPVVSDDSEPDSEQTDPEVELPEGDPDQTWTKPQIQAYLDLGDIHWTTSMTKDELLELV